MKLYHASPIVNRESIENVGLYPTGGGTRNYSGSISLQGKGLMGIYGFSSTDSAKNFAEDNQADGEFCVFEFETGDLEIILDPEYEEEEGSFFVLTDEPLKVF